MRNIPAAARLYFSEMDWMTKKYAFYCLEAHTHQPFSIAPSLPTPLPPHTPFRRSANPPPSQPRIAGAHRDHLEGGGGEAASDQEGAVRLRPSPQERRPLQRSPSWGRAPG